jgi:hypothetical protein
MRRGGGHARAARARQAGRHARARGPGLLPAARGRHAARRRAPGALGARLVAARLVPPTW